MAPNFTGVVLKRHRPQEKIDRNKVTNKCQRFSSNTPTEDLLGDSVEDESVAMVYKETTTYDDLLATLGSSNKVVADMNRRRQREEEGKSDTEGDEDEENSGSEGQSSTDGEDDEIQGPDQESLGGLSRNTEQEENDDNQSEEDDSEYSETDEDNELSTDDGHSSLVASSSTCAFSEHLSHKLSSEQVEALKQGNWKFKWEAPAIGMPHCTWKGTRPNFLHFGQSDATYGIKPKLFKHWLQLYEKIGGEDFDSSTRRRFFSICNSYMDILQSNKTPFYNRGRGEDSSHMDAYLMHSLNHIFRSRDVVKKNESKIAKLSYEEALCDDRFRDKGFTCPKVLILLPLRSIAFRVVNRLIQLTPEAHRVNVENLVRFNDEFGFEEESDEDDGKPSKPRDWQALLGDGNNDDTFMIGIKHTRKSIKLYGDFYSSDMIIASPVGLLVAMGKAEENKQRGLDFLSSIEVLVIDHADVMSMQNWAHVATVVEKLNDMTSDLHGTNIMRIRQLYLDGHARFYRQSIILSSYLTPEINSLFSHLCVNYKGKMKLECKYKGVLNEVLSNVNQVYVKFDAGSMPEVDNARFEHFTKKIFPKIKNSVQGGVMIFMNSHVELSKLRRFLRSQKASFCIVNEYASTRVKSRARQEFFAGSKNIMLYTERAHFYFRYKIRGIKNLIIYSLPERKEFYPQIMNMIEESHYMESTVLLCPLDLFRLQRIVGHASAKAITSSEQRTFIFR